MKNCPNPEQQKFAASMLRRAAAAIVQSSLHPAFGDGNDDAWNEVKLAVQLRDQASRLDKELIIPEPAKPVIP